MTLRVDKYSQSSLVTSIIMMLKMSYFLSIIGMLLMKNLPRRTISFSMSPISQQLPYGRNIYGVNSRISYHHRTWNTQIASKGVRWLSQQKSSNRDDITTSISSTTNESTTATDMYDFIPSLDQLRNDPFMKQVRHAEFITSLFEEDNGRETSVLMDRLRAQLSHPDGIRGFMVTYLTTTTTTSSSNNNDDDDHHEHDIPLSLIKVIIEQIDPIHDKNELVSLMCMNVIMPTAMITMQPTEEMSQQSSQTAKRAIQLLKSVLLNCYNHEIRQAIINRCNDILSVTVPDATNDVPTDTKEEGSQGGQSLYWSQFFKKWGYKSRQQSDIANAIRSILQE